MDNAIGVWSWIIQIGGGDNVGPGDVGPYLLWQTTASYYYTLPLNKRVLILAVLIIHKRDNLVFVSFFLFFLSFLLGRYK